VFIAQISIFEHGKTHTQDTNTQTHKVTGAYVHIDHSQYMGNKEQNK